MDLRGLGAATLFALTAAAPWACGSAAFVCQSDEECTGGRCETDGYCSFADEMCASGRRYGALSGGPLAGQCVGETGTTSGASASSTTSPSASASGGPGTSADATSSTTTPVDSDTNDPTTGSVGDPTTSTTTDSTGGDTGTTGGQAIQYDFYDDFERPDDGAVGNDWIEKTPPAFSLVNGTLRRTSGATDYADNLVYRANASWSEVELHLELDFDETAPAGHPQMVARVQDADVAVASSVTGYLLFITNEDELQITRQIAGSFTRQSTEVLASSLSTSDFYRLRLRVAGTDPVMVDGYLDRETQNGWVIHTEVHMVDDTAERISAAGTVAISAHTELESFGYHSFGVLDLAGR